MMSFSEKNDVIFSGMSNRIILTAVSSLLKIDFLKCFNESIKLFFLHLTNPLISQKPTLFVTPI